MAAECDFVVDLSGRPGSYQLHVSSPAGDDNFEIPLESAAIEADLQDLQTRLLASSSATRALVSELEQPLRDVGQRLYEAMFHNMAGALLMSSRNEVQRSGGRLRIVLRLRAPELAVLPWELMYSSRYGGYLCRLNPMVRYVDVPEPARPLTVRPPLRVLGMTALPGDLAALDADTEKDRLERLLTPLQNDGLVVLDWVDGQSWEAAQDALYGGCHIFHFIGHGGFDPDRREGLIAFVGERGRSQPVTATALAELLSLADPMPRLVVLNSCQTAAGSATDLFSGTAATLVRTVPAVVAMQFAITDPAANVFSRAFYQALVHNRGVDEAVRAGRIALTGWNPDTLEWLTPVLYLRSHETQLFDVEPVSHLPVWDDKSDERRAAALENYWTAHHTGDWEPVVAELQSLLARSPDDREVARAYDDARLAARYAQGRRAEGVSDWDVAVGHYEAVQNVRPDYRDVAARLAACTQRRDVAALQNRLRAMFTAGKYSAVVGISERLAELDPSAADPDGLASKAGRKLSISVASSRPEPERSSPHEESSQEAAQWPGAAGGHRDPGRTATPVDLTGDPRYADALGSFFAGRWTEAVERFEALHLSYPDEPRLRSRLETARRERDLERWSASADAAMERGDWDGAVGELERIAEVNPAYRDAERRLERARMAQRRESLVDEMRVLYQAGRWRAVVAAGDDLARLDPNQPDPDGMLAQARMQLREADLTARYTQAVRLLDEGQWKGAGVQLEAIQREHPDYRDTTALLAGVHARISYEQGRRAEDNHDWAVAADCFQTVIATLPDYRDTQRRLNSCLRRQQLIRLHSDLAQLLTKRQDVAALPKASLDAGNGSTPKHASRLAEIWKVAKQTNWTHRPWKSDLKRLATALGREENIVGCTRLSRSFTTSFAAVVTDQALYLGTDSPGDLTWKQLREQIPSSFSPSPDNIRIPLDEVLGPVEVVNDNVLLRLRGRDQLTLASTKWTGAEMFCRYVAQALKRSEDQTSGE